MFDNKNTPEFTQLQIEMIDYSIKILRTHFKEKLQEKEFNDKYGKIFYGHCLPNHIYQVLLPLKSKIANKPIVNAIKKKHWLSTFKVRSLNKEYCYTSILKYWEEVSKYE